jgi:hypothetical protein
MAENQSVNPIEAVAEDRLAKAWMNAVKRTEVSPRSVERAKFWATTFVSRFLRYSPPPLTPSKQAGPTPHWPQVLRVHSLSLGLLAWKGF